MITKHSTRGLWSQFGRFINLIGGNKKTLILLSLTCTLNSTGLIAVAEIVMLCTCCFHRWTFKQLYDKGMVYRGFKVKALNNYVTLLCEFKAYSGNA